MRFPLDLHIEGKLELGLGVRVVDLEQAVHKLFQVDVAA